MFDKLNRKYSITLLCVISSVLILYSSVLFVFYCNILKSDYNNKINKFNKQYVANIETRLNMIENISAMFFNKFGLSNSEQLHSFSVTQALRKTKHSATHINSIFLENSTSQYYLTLHDVKLLDILHHSHPEIFDNPQDINRWFYVSYNDKYQDELLYIQLKENGTIMGVSLLVNEFLLDINQNNHKAVYFSENIQSSALTPNNDALISANDIDNGIKEKTYGYSVKVGQKPFTMNIENNNKHFQTMLILFFIGILILCISIFVAARIILKKFLKRLTESLTALYHQFSEDIINNQIKNNNRRE